MISDGAPDRVISRAEMEAHLRAFIDKLGYAPQRILLLPPDITRFYSEAGSITAYLHAYLKPRAEAVHVMPALGTHTPMTEKQIRSMFGPDIPLDDFLIHDWRTGVKKVGVIPGEFIRELSSGRLDYAVEVEIDKAVTDGGYDLILSIGQIVPHEVVGMANYTKNVCIGVGGKDIINRSHFLGAVVDMEKLMGRTDTPVRRLLNHAFETFLGHLPIHFIMTVIGRAEEGLALRGLYAGGEEAYRQAAELSRKVNLDLLDAPLKKVVVYLEPEEFKSTWLGNKAVYRTRMAIADDGELIVLAPAVREFGEDKGIDELIRKYGYYGTLATLDAVKRNADLGGNLSAAAHLIHGSSEGRFRITYCTRPENLPKSDIEGVGFQWASYDDITARYDPANLKNGFNTIDGETVFYISNPALGLWALKDLFQKE
ncbi:MAG: lactate racemase domain-containing protein [Rhodospirillales bacterium]|jgi:nickel-dependent lactate racemase|nr:lactate racemase domain-containing protein [Rhodospirillales bacterium]